MRPAKQADTTLGLREDHQESVAEVRKDCAMQRLKPLDLYACALFPASSERTLPFGAKYSLQSRPLSTATCYRLIHVTCSSSTSSLPLCSSTFISQSTRFTKPQHLTLPIIHQNSDIKTQTSSGARTLSQSSKKPFCPSQPWLRRSKESASQFPFDRGPQPIEAHNSRYCSYKSFKRNSSHNSASLHHLSCVLGSPSGQVDYHDEDLLAVCADRVVLGCFEGGGDTTRRMA